MRRSWKHRRAARTQQEGKRSMHSIRALLFDLGGTLWEWRPGLSVEDMLAEMMPLALTLLPSEQAANLSPHAAAHAVRRAYVELEDEAARGDTKPIPAELPVLRGFASLGVTIDRETARAVLVALYVPERRTTRLLPGVDDLLRALALRQVRMGIISNRMHGGTLLLDDLEYFGISHYFASVIASCDVGQMKPHPALFQRALDDLGVSPLEAVMVGDDLRADVGGALAAGMRAIWVRRPPERPDPAPPGVSDVTRMDQVLPALERMGLRAR
jgi:putative hydrolase of the HAD superfamily